MKKRLSRNQVIIFILLISFFWFIFCRGMENSADIEQWPIVLWSVRVFTIACGLSIVFSGLSLLNGFIQSRKKQPHIQNAQEDPIPDKKPWPKKTDEKVREARRAEMGRLRAKIANKEKAENKPSENISDAEWEIVLHEEDQIYEKISVKARCSEGRLTVTATTSEKAPGGIYSTEYMLDERNTKKLANCLGRSEQIQMEMKKHFGGADVEQFVQFCKKRGIDYKTYAS